MRWHDRLGATSAVDDSQAEQAPWRYVLDLGTGAHRLSLGSRQLKAEPEAVSLLLGTENVHLRWTQDGVWREQQLRSTAGRKHASAPAAIELRRLQMSGRDESSGESILFPLATPPEVDCDYEGLIALIEDHAASIASICSRPRLSLRVEERAEELRRARRMTHRTAPYLARHSEDWEGQSLRMPFPRRLLTALPEDEWATYENRLVRTVVRDAYTELCQRARELRSLLQQTEAALRVAGSIDGIEREDWARMHRMYSLLRGNISSTQLLQRCEELKRQLERIQRAATILGAARSSPLFRRLGPTSDVRELRPTNLLLHDPAYHAALVVRQRLNRLMHARSERAVEDPLGPYYCWLKLALHEAFTQTGFKQEEPHRYAGHDWLIDVQHESQLRRIKLSFKRRDEDTAGEQPSSRSPCNDMLPRCQTSQKRQAVLPSIVRSRPPLVILPVWLRLADAGERAALLDEVTDAAHAERYLILFPGIGGDGASERPGPATEQLPHGVIAASPARLDSVEILARELVRETWLRDLTRRRWPRWCPSCPQDGIYHGGAKKFVCATCKLEAGMTRRPCSCDREHEAPYLERRGAASSADSVSRSDILSSSSTGACDAVLLKAG